MYSGVLGGPKNAINWVTVTSSDGKRSVRKTGEEWLALSDRFSPAGEPLFTLSKREREIASYVAKGMTNPEISAELFITNETVKEHMSNIFEKSGFKHRMQVGIWWATTQEPLLKGSADVSPQQEEKRDHSHQR